MGSCLGDNKNSHRLDKSVEIAGFKIQICDKISHGAYGDIWKCRDKNSGKIYAAKQIKLLTKQMEQMFRKEILWLQNLKDVKGIIKMIGHTKIKGKDKQFDIGIILTQFYEMNLLDRLKNKTLQILNFLKQVSLTLLTIHKQKCIHLDIKPENILLQSSQNTSFSYLICDFGSCLQGPIYLKNFRKVQKSNMKEYLEANSTMIYRPPQLINIQSSTELIDGKTDMWMLGCVAYLLLYRKHPFGSDGQLGILTGCHQYPQATDIEEDQSQEFNKIVEFIKRMLTINQKERISDEELYNEIVQMEKQ